MTLHQTLTRARVISFAALLACTVVLAGCAYELVHNGAINETKADRIEIGIQQIRDLRFRSTPPMVIETRDEAELQMKEDLERDYTDEELQADGVAGALVGLYPSGIDLKDASLKLMRSQVAGFYDPHSKQMVLVDDGTDLGFWIGASQLLVQRDVVGEMLLAHELTHALQDQHFDLEKKMDAIKDNDDRLLAIKAVAEGDATIAGLAYVMGAMDNGTLDDIESRLSEIPGEFAAETPGTPEGLSAPLIFQYTDGVTFVGQAYRREGWKAVDALYANPPQSTHEILHPALYYNRGVTPAKIELNGYQGVMASWKTADEDTYGELLIRTLLERNMGKREKSKAMELASRWAGDKMLVLRDENAICVIWMIVFSDSGAAGQFAAAYASLLDRLLGDRAHELDYRGNAVLVVVGEGAHYFGIMAPAIWKATRIVPATDTPRTAPVVSAGS